MMSYRVFAAAILVAAASGISACKAPPSGSAPQLEPASVTAPQDWFICDGLDAQRVVVAQKSADGKRALVTLFEKPGATPVLRAEYDIGEAEGAAGHVETPLLRDGAVAGMVRATNPGMLETPGANYTPVVGGFRLGDTNLSCRWMPRTRVIGFSETRFYVLSEDGDGDLVLDTYLFGGELRRVIELSDNARTTVFDSEARGGSETTGPGGTEYRFEQRGDLTILVTPKEGPATVELWRGNTQVMSETLVAYQAGKGPE